MCLAHSVPSRCFDVSNDLVVSFEMVEDKRHTDTFHGSPQWCDQEVQDVWCPWTPGLLSVVEASPLTSMVCCCLLCQECIYEGMMRDYHRCGCRFAYVVLW